MRILLTTRRELDERRNPIALLDMAAYLRHFGHAVDCYYLDQLDSHHKSGPLYDVVGLSVLQTLNEHVPVSDALYLKKRYGTDVVVGGKWTQTTSESQRAMLAGHDIKVWTGPGERYFVDREIDFAAYPSWDRVDFETLNDVRADIMSARGCPYHCHFCHNTEKKLSFFSARRTADNIRLLFELGVQNIFFCDDIFTLRPSHMEALYHELKARAIDIEHRSEFFTHVKHINQGILRWIKIYNPYRISVGVESGDDAMLKLMGKGFDSETAFRNMKLLHDETGLTMGALFIIGFPGETEESLRRTLDFIKRIRPFAGSWVSYYQPVSGTKGYEMALERSGKITAGRRNTSMTYVDPNLSRRLLFKYHYMMMDFSEDNGLRKRLMYLLINMLPYGLLTLLRELRQKKRLRDLMSAYLRATN